MFSMLRRAAAARVRAGWRGLLPLVACLVLSSATPQPVFADTIPPFQPGQGTATIDGNIDPAEWATADSLPLSMASSGGTTTLTGTLHVMQDATNLYLGFTVNDDEFTTAYKFGLYGDTMQFEFDDNNSGALFEVGENKVTLFAADPWYKDSHYYNTMGSSTEDTAAGGSTDGAGYSARRGSENHYELSFPLCSGDAYDFCLQPGDIVGLRVKYYDMYLVAEEPEYDAHLYPDDEVTSLVRIQLADEIYRVFVPLVFNQTR